MKYILFGLPTSTEYEYYSGLRNDANTNTNTNSTCFSKNHLDTNTNSIRFENICRIRISLCGLNYSNTIPIPNYSLTSDKRYKNPVDPTMKLQALQLWMGCFACSDAVDEGSGERG